MIIAFLNSCESTEEGFALLEENSIMQADSELDGEILFESYFRR